MISQQNKMSVRPGPCVNPHRPAGLPGSAVHRTPECLGSYTEGTTAATSEKEDRLERGISDIAKVTSQSAFDFLEDYQKRLFIFLKIYIHVHPKLTKVPLEVHGLICPRSLFAC